MSHKFYFYLLLSIVSFYNINAQGIDTILFSPQQLQDDANALFRHLHKHHPDPYYYCGFEEFEKKKYEIFSQLDRPMTRDEFLMIIGTINSCLDEHSAVKVIMSPYLWRWIDIVENNDSIIFPRVYINGHKLYGDINGERSEILSINGVETREILEFMSQYVGKATTRWFDYRLESFFASWIYTFFDIQPPFDLVFKTNKRIRRETIKGITYDKFKHFTPPAAVEALLPYYKVYPSSSIAIITINTFCDKALSEIDLNKTLKVFRDSIMRSNIQYLFIDVSKNGGGSAVEMVKPFNLLQHDTIYFSTTSSYVPHINQNHTLFVPKYSERISLPNDCGFKGKLFVLQGTLSTSGGDIFCRIVDHNNLGIRVGQNTGDPTKNFTFITGEIRLPNTQMGYVCSTVFLDYSQEGIISESLEPDMFWETDYILNFTEEELKKIIKEWNNRK